MKLVVCYTLSDGCTYSNDVVLCLEYESCEYQPLAGSGSCLSTACESFLVNFELALKKAIRVEKERQEIWDKFIEAKLSPNAKREAKYLALYDSFMKEHPSAGSGKFDFADYEFEIWEFYTREQIELPEVYELNEWWTGHQVNRKK